MTDPGLLQASQWKVLSRINRCQYGTCSNTRKHDEYKTQALLFCSI